MDIYSFSKLNTFNTCEFQYYIQYVLGDRGKDNVYNLHGTKFHELTEKLQKGEITNKQALEKFDEIVIEHSLSNKEFISDKIEQNYFQSLRNYFEYFTPFKAKRFDIEYSIMTAIGKPRRYKYTDHYGNDYSCIAPPLFRGFIDLTLHFENKEIDIIDLKTSTIYDKHHRIANGRQLVLYALSKMQRGYKIRGVFWDFLKYSRCSWNGKRSKRVMRKEIVSAFQNQIYDELVAQGEDPLIAQLLVEKAVEENNLNLLPESVSSLLSIEKEIIEYPFNEETIKDALDFVDNTVKAIESKNGLEHEYKFKSITKFDNFFCSNICGVRDKCPAYKKFIEENKDNFKDKESGIDEDLFMSVLG